MNFRTRAARFALAWDQKPAPLLAIFLLCYSLMLIFPIQRHLWHDELFTYYISQARDIPTLLWESRHLDLNPPMVYAVTRSWQHAFGTNETVTRIPSTVAFGLASLGYVVFLRRRMGWLWAIAAILLFWASPNFMYATELRPYALLLFFFAALLLSWDAAHSEQHRAWGLVGVLVSATGMMLTHMLAIFPLGAVYLGELVGTARNRRIDWPLWVCLLAPLGVVFTYFEANQAQRVQASAYPPGFQAGPRKVGVYIAKTVLGIALPFGLAVAAMLFVSGPQLRVRWKSLRPRDGGLWVGLLSIPLLINLILMLSHSAFFERYALLTSLAAAVTALIVIGAMAGWSRVAALCSCIVLLACGLQKNFVRPWWQTSHAVKTSVAEQVPPDLPLVASSGLAFLEMDHYEKADFLKRVYFLTDHDAAVKYAHATIFDGMALEAQYFPFRSNVSPYYAFIKSHSRFLVFGTMGFAEDWVLRKLVADGAKVQQIRTLKSLPYNDTAVYQVDIPPPL
jgi:hypothetical protein